jgi:hypothetical protein
LLRVLSTSKDVENSVANLAAVKPPFLTALELDQTAEQLQANVELLRERLAELQFTLDAERSRIKQATVTIKVTGTVLAVVAVAFVIATCVMSLGSIRTPASIGIALSFVVCALLTSRIRRDANRKNFLQDALSQRIHILDEISELRLDRSR